MSKLDTLVDYGFEDWIPIATQEMIRSFWNAHDGVASWRKDQINQGASHFSYHGPNPNGFRLPPYGGTAEYFLINWELTKQSGGEVFNLVKGRYVHRWNNMGSLIDIDGKDWTVSTCDRWVRCFASDEEKEIALS